MSSELVTTTVAVSKRTDMGILSDATDLKIETQNLRSMPRTSTLLPMEPKRRQPKNLAFFQLILWPYIFLSKFPVLVNQENFRELYLTVQFKRTV